MNWIRDKIKKFGDSLKKYTRRRPSKNEQENADWINCPSCKKLLNNVDDIESVKNNDVCEECFLTHYYQNKEKWENGWRPYK